MTGKKTITLKNREVDTGKLVNGNSNGYGKIVFNDGSKYIGHLKNSKEHGKGKYILGKNKIIGIWFDGILMVRFVYISKNNNNGNEYIGGSKVIPERYK